MATTKEKKRGKEATEEKTGSTTRKNVTQKKETKENPDLKETAESKKSKENIKEEKETSKETHDSEKEKVDEKSFWEEALDSISEGAKVAGDEARTLTGKISDYSEKFWQVLKDKSSDAYKAGSDMTKDAVNYAQRFAEKYKDRQEMRNLQEEKDEYSAKLGIDVYLALKNNNNKLPEGYFEQDNVKSLISHIEDVDKKILKLSEDLSKS